MSDLEHVVGIFERGFASVSDGPAQSTNQHGEVYVNLCSGGMRAEGQPIPVLFAKPIAAAYAWLETATAYRAQGDRHLYWRTRPRLEAIDNAGSTYWAVYSRLVVSDIAPVKPPAPVLRKYRSHKLVDAAPILAWFDPNAITAQGPNVTVGSNPDNVETINVPKDFFARGAPTIGDYLVRYEDGYLSWSPKKAFEDGYTLE